MRPRIKTQSTTSKSSLVISARGRIVFAREDVNVTQYQQRRTTFFKTRNMLDCVEVVTTELLTFNQGVAQSILEWKKQIKQS